MPTSDEQRERRQPVVGRARRPLWIPPFLGGVPDIEPTLIRLLGAVSLGLLFEAYDASLLTSALKHIAEGLEMKESELGPYLGVIRLGSLPALIAMLTPFRRLVLLRYIGAIDAIFHGN